MDPTSPGYVTRLFSRWLAGDEEAVDELLPRIYEELRRLADSYLFRDRAGLTLEPTELVHEVFLRLLGSDAEAVNRVHFFALAAQVMRRLLVDRARRQNADKRFAPRDRVTLHTGAAIGGGPEVDVLDLHRALATLAEIAPRPARLVELRFFGGLTLPEAAQVAGISRATAARDWEAARIWLSGELDG
ncbi:MAG: ECF-type sigma factor [Holophagales bacterium]|nr:ECF-type sigma factor [Holophagales bacterium]